VQFLSLVVMLGVLIAAAIAIAFAAVIGAPIVAIPFFLVFFGVFLMWRGKRRAEHQLRQRHGAGTQRVPTTEEASADPVHDSSVADVARRGPS
jgi:hypothetical protein